VNFAKFYPSPYERPSNFLCASCRTAILLLLIVALYILVSWIETQEDADRFEHCYFQANAYTDSEAEAAVKHCSGKSNGYLPRRFREGE